MVSMHHGQIKNWHASSEVKLDTSDSRFTEVVVAHDACRALHC